ncbi:bifunctional diguanylate cyclase/phosphodiesterase [Oscillatoria sp. HE19RPO]|uniref:putative bifunctional diguanylate cyclase/phosphodiesterase n=1 Tax=Oscillatoria sp. HE19RPO TaxID=2954806 RepID=UPI0020C2D602|nr:EAL domain-containing response regulator [Oscillatoria sp. HE19RPO]
MTKILVIEDEESVRCNIIELLEAENFDVIAAENGQLGVLRAKNEVPDLILCDVMMPQLDGYGVLSELREDPSSGTIPFIFLTAKSSRQDWRQGMELGADDYLTKPFTREELLMAIATRLKKSRTIQQRYGKELERLQQQCDRLLNFDETTGLPNLRQLRSHLHQLISNHPPERETSELVVVVSLEIDRWKRIEENLGSLKAQQLLNAIGQRLREASDSRDLLAHITKNTFVLIPRGLDSVESVVVKTQSLRHGLSRPFLVDGQEIAIATSIGISFYPKDGADSDALIENAKTAKDHAKRNGGNQYQFYLPTARVAAPRRLELETSLYYALERSEFQVYYQPQVDLIGGQIIGAEALVRWQHPEWGLVSPGDFIPLAEETGWIVPIGEWVLLTACRQAKAWANLGFPLLKIGVNLSIRQLNQIELIERLVTILQQTEMDPQWLELELTESMVVQNVEETIRRLQEIRSLGIQISIDDFGTGYSSLGYLNKLPLDTLKIDRCFIDGIDQNPKNAALTQAIIQMANSLKLKTLAEGVETLAELTFLCQSNCNAMQGYFFSKPLKADDFQQLLVSKKQLPIPG